MALARRTITLLVAVPLAAVVLLVGGTWVYIELIRDEPLDRLAVSPSQGGRATGDMPLGLDGRWEVSSGSQAGYRVKEILFGQRAEAVGRTQSVSGQARVQDMTVVEASFSVDLATVTSDESRRDGQFRGRIMDVDSYPTATFRLTDRIALQALPAEGQAKLEATGDLTLRGTTKRVTVDLDVKRSSGSVEAAGRIPIVFSEWGIPDPSFGPAQTEDRGELEFLLVFRPSR